MLTEPTAVSAKPALLPTAILALTVFMLLAVAPQIYNDGDTGWHIVAGRWIVTHLSVPATDPFSYTYAGKPWLAHEWLAEILMAGAHAAGGWAGLSLLTAAAIAGLIFVIGAEIGRWLRPIPTLATLILVVIALIPFILARPHVLAWPLLAIWTIILIRAREADRPPALVAALIMLVWANLHASFLYGLVLAGAFGLEALVTGPDRRRVFLGWLGFGAAALAATLVTPYGLDGLLFPLQVSSMKAIPTIIEWRPTIVANESGFQLFLLAAIFTCLYRGVRVPLFRLVIVIATLYLAFSAVRHQAILAIVGALILAKPLAATFPPLTETALPRRARTIAATLAALLLVFIAVRLAIPTAQPDNASNPSAMIASLPAALRHQPVLNDYGFGGALVFAGVRPYMDGRIDMYGDDFAFEHGRMIHGDIAAFDRIAARRGITWTILNPTTPLVAVLDAHPGWHRLASDRWSVVHVRQGSASPP
ncbi:hypothetical protein GCM10011529_16990 [Polymorphobacter glacialis]|uniref:Uncharacterized protein n=1 Tax=Sandarakinorhabdus glacialis TaxID=1614636 RepID=A0A916ZSR7_9SPHN|nr:hypothetical protein [Polymorphobacter glacialis]GGE11247.1 hypothetical protein GCM10011529_16990 [Polymorphobacter glacialis]